MFQRTRPVRVAGIADAVGIDAGGAHACALLRAGHLMCWGAVYDELGNGPVGAGTGPPRRDYPEPVFGLTDVVSLTAGSNHSCAARRDGTVACWGSNGRGQLGSGTVGGSTGPVDVVGLGNAATVSAGKSHSCALRTDGRVVCWGSGDDGQLGE